MQTRRSRAGLTLPEAVVGLAVFGMLMLGLYMLLRQVGLGSAKVTALASAASSAELAIGYLSTDLGSMLPPQPREPQRCYRIERNGRRVAFHRLERSGQRLVAVPVVYETRPAAPGSRRLHLYRNGRRIGGIDLEDLVLTEENSRDRAGARWNPTLEITVTGASPESDPLTGQPARHRIRMSVRVPDTTPLAMAALPSDARDMIGSVIESRGSLP